MEVAANSSNSTLAIVGVVTAAVAQAIDAVVTVQCRALAIVEIVVDVTRTSLEWRDQ